MARSSSSTSRTGRRTRSPGILARDGEVYAGFEDLLERTAAFLRPTLLREPPSLGSKNPLDIAGLLREGARAAGLSKRDVHDLVRIFMMSVGDLLDDWFEHDGLKGSIASTGVVGVGRAPGPPGPRTTCCTTPSASSTGCRASGDR